MGVAKKCLSRGFKRMYSQQQMLSLSSSQPSAGEVVATLLGADEYPPSMFRCSFKCVRNEVFIGFASPCRTISWCPPISRTAFAIQSSISKCLLIPKAVREMGGHHDMVLH